MANNNSLNNTSYGFTLPSLNLNFTSTAQRITGDMSNATHANRLAFQSSTVNGNTSLFVLPNGSGVSSSVLASNANDPTNSAFAQIQIDNTSVKLISSVLGAGVQLPMEIRIGSTAAIDINTSRAVSIANTVAGNVPLTITATNIGGLGVNQANSGAVSISLTQSSADLQPNYINIFKNRAGGNINAGDIISQMQFLGFATAAQLAAQSRCYAESIGAARVSGAFDWWTTSAAGSINQRLYIGSDGNVVINQPASANTALFINGFNTAGSIALQSFAATPGALFSAFRALNNTVAAGSSCQIECSVSSQVAATGGDPYLRFVNYGVQGLSLGLDTSVNQFSMSTGNLGDANTFLTYDIATTQINKPRQCAFLAYLGSDDLNVTGNGAIYTLGAVTALTEVYDQSNNFNTNGTFTAPKSGRYHFAAAIRVFGTGGLATGYQIRFNTTGGLIIGGQGVPTLGSGFFTATCSSYVNMTTGDTCILQIQLTGMAGDTADINGASSVTYFGGTLVC